MAEPLISVVVLAAEGLEETLASVESQSYPNREVVLVGADRGGDERIRPVPGDFPSSSAARNAGVREARGDYFIPVDAGDALGASMLAAGLAELSADPGAAYAYSDYRLFGERNYIESPGEFSFYRLLEEPFVPACSLVHKRAWATSGGYDEELSDGYEDWDFWIGLAENGFFGVYIPAPLFRRRYVRRRRDPKAHAISWARMERRRPQTLSPEGRLRVKRERAPSICVVAAGVPPDLSNQTLRDFQVLESVNEAEALGESNAPAFFWIAGGGKLRPQALEQAALGLTAADWVTWRDTGDAPPPSMRAAAGPLGLSRAALQRPEPSRSGDVLHLPWRCRLDEPAAAPELATRLRLPPRSKRKPASWMAAFAAAERYLQENDLLTPDAWVRRPLQSATALLPPRLRNRLNAWAGSEIFDLRLAANSTPRSVVIQGRLFEPVDYIAAPERDGRKRVAVVAPHLSYGGAETALFELIRRIDRSQAELLLVVEHAGDARMRERWSAAVDSIYDLAKLTDAQSAPRVLLSLLVAWDVDALIVMSSTVAYAVLPAWKDRRAAAVALDLIPASDDALFETAVEATPYVGRRIAFSEKDRRRLEEMEAAAGALVIPQAVDLARFDPERYDRAALRRKLGATASTVVLAALGRLEEEKGTLLLADVARELERRSKQKILFAVGGHGSLEPALRVRIRKLGVEKSFRVLGYVQRPWELLAAADGLIIPFEAARAPLAALEAQAMRLPVIAVRSDALNSLPAKPTLVEPGPDEALRFADAIAERFADPALLRPAGDEARAAVAQTHSLERARERYSAVADEMLASAKRRFVLGAAVPPPPKVTRR